MTMIREKDETASTTTGEEKETSLDFIQKLASTISSPKPSRSTSSTPLHAQTSKAAESPMPKPERLTIPDFKIIHQHKFNDYQKFAGSSGHEVRQDFASRPDALVIKISLPGVASAALVDVDFTPDGLGLDLLVPGEFFYMRFLYINIFLMGRVELYKLHLDLPFPVLDEESKAKFDKKSRTLNIEVPVVPAPIVEMVICCFYGCSIISWWSQPTCLIYLYFKYSQHLLMTSPLSEMKKKNQKKKNQMKN